MYPEQTLKPRGEVRANTVIRGASVRVGGDPARIGIPGQCAGEHAEPAESAKEPRIEIVRSGEIIQAIDIFCGCGEHIRLHCLYS
jgi:hypothetical protein